MGARHAPLALWVGLALAIGGCPQAIDTADDDARTGADDGGAADGGTLDSDGDVPDDGGVPDGSSADANLGSDGGEGSDAGRPLTWGRMLVPGSSPITCIWGRSADEIYAGTQNGNVLRYTPGAGWAVAWHSPSNNSIVAIKGGPNNLFVLDFQELYVHAGGLDVSAPSFYPAGSGQNGPRDLAVVSDSEVYVVADQANGGSGLYHYDGNALTRLMTIDVAELTGVVATGGVVRMAGTGRVYRYDAQVLSEETVDWPVGFTPTDIAYYTFYGLDLVGSQLMIAAKQQAVLERDPGGTWRRAYEPMRDENLYAIAGHDTAAGLEAYAVGPDATNAGPILVRDPLLGWKSAGVRENWHLYDLWSPAPGLYFAAGGLGSSFEPVIVRGQAE